MAPWDGYRAPPPARLGLAALPCSALPPPPPPPPPHVCAPYCNPHTCWDPQCTACTDLGCVGPPPPPYWYWPSLPPDPAPPASPTPSPPPIASQDEPSPPSSPSPSAPAPPLPPLNTTGEHGSLPIESPVVLVSYDSYDTAGEMEDGTLAADWQGQTRSCAQLEERCDVSRCCADSEQSCFVVARRGTPPSVEARHGHEPEVPLWWDFCSDLSMVLLLRMPRKEARQV
ncbi:hypothetical protein AB1Y20_019734 [Prymnesium parvum]|uniref:SREBP regulating gene protein n=1 Tax=Prymnesium parvum TaxID=97485 RepID=A0AB34JT61_PRYPA